MPLIIDGLVYNDISTVLDYIFTSDYFKESSSVLLATPLEEMPRKGLLYVNQREFAVCPSDDPHIQVIGTDDATTCHIVVLRHTGSGVTGLAHYDGLDTEAGLKGMVDAITALSENSTSGRLEVHLVGGFMDSGQESIKLSKRLLQALIDLLPEMHLLTACITNLNDTLRDSVHFPVIYGIAVNLHTGKLFSASFPHQGPGLDIRAASHFVGFKKMLNIYDSGTGVLKVGPFMWEPTGWCSNWCDLPDPFIRKYLSTSPAQEPHRFENHVRAALKVIKRHPEPHLTLFPDGQPHRYCIQPDGRWLRLEATV